MKTLLLLLLAIPSALLFAEFPHFGVPGAGVPYLDPLKPPGESSEDSGRVGKSFKCGITITNGSNPSEQKTFFEQGNLGEPCNSVIAKLQQNEEAVRYKRGNQRGAVRDTSNISQVSLQEPNTSFFCKEETFEPSCR